MRTINLELPIETAWSLFGQLARALAAQPETPTTTLLPGLGINAPIPEVSYPIPKARRRKPRKGSHPTPRVMVACQYPGAEPHKFKGTPKSKYCPYHRKIVKSANMQALAKARHPPWTA